MARFADKSIVITGGSSGIGLATARRIVAEGGRVLITGTDAGKLERVRGENIATLVNDSGNPEAAEALADEARRLFGTIDGLFLNAGIGAGIAFGEITPEFYRRMMDINVGGPLFGAQALAPVIRDGGAILVTASAAKDKGLASGIVYSASKGAVRSLVRGLARAFAPRQIRVNLISPGPIETPFFDRTGLPPEQIEGILTQARVGNPLGRVGTVEEAAAVACFLLSDESSFVNGSDYAVDGGSVQM